MRLYGATILSGAFLLFLVQPIAGRILLPQFGGSAGVWIACLLFFQVALLLGYLYAHWVAARAPALLHLALLGASVLLLPRAAGQPSGHGDPTFEVLKRLTILIGLPYFVLSTTSPLLQAWLSRRGSQLPYRFFALSNAGALAGLLLYPVLIEPYFTLRQQTLAWAAGYLVFAVLCGLSTRRAEAAQAEATVPRLIWLVLAACPSALLLSVTNLLTQNVAPIPFLWVLPLGLYLLSFILCFEGHGWYNRSLFQWLVTAAIFALAFTFSLAGTAIDIRLLIFIASAAFFVCCMFCHGELARLKPAPRLLTSFYLMVALGGAVGGLFAGLLAPRLFNDYYEFPLALAVCALLTWMLFAKTSASTFRFALTLFLVGYVSWIALDSAHGARFVARNFYGTLRVSDSGGVRKLLHGAITHGSQFLSPDRARQVTTYYGPASGAALSIEHSTPGPRRVGLVGLGAGTLAAYGRPGDYYRFYEINPLVIRVAKSEFTYLSDSAAKVDVVEGDARVSLQAEPDQRFDVLALDAFSGDSIPVHLLTREAFQIYFRHLKPDGVLAVHVSNRYLDLAPVVAKLAAALGKTAAQVVTPGDEKAQTLLATWILVGSNLEFPRVAARDDLRLWTDDYSNLFQVLKR